MSELADLVTKMETLATGQAALSAAVGEVKKNAEEARGKAPWARRGEDPFTSRGFQYGRVIGAMTGKMDKGLAKVEIDLINRIRDEYVARGHFTKDDDKSVVVPFASCLMSQNGDGMEKIAREVAEVTSAGVAGCDPDEMAHARRRAFPGQTQKALNWQDESGLGNLVGPAVMGEPIEILRNQEVFMKAGARVIPFPPSGRATWPRFTGTTTAFWVGTGALAADTSRTLTASEPTTGDVVLQSKKLGVLVKIPNELFRFPTVSVEQVIREDMMKTASLFMDETFLSGAGSSLQPKGIINYLNINRFPAGVTGANGDTLQPEDILKMVGTVEEQNLDFGAWVMRPLMYAAVGNRRADAVAPGDAKGMFLFNVLRELQGRNVDVTNNAVGMLEGYPVHKTNQILKNRVKGSASNLTYVLGGQFSQWMIAMSGVMEFMVTNVGDTAFTTDASWIRLLTWCDAAPRHEEAFILMDNLLVA